MRVCDKHRDRRAVDTIVLTMDDVRIDLCSECKTDLISLMSEPVEPELDADKLNGGRRRGRPPKNSATADTSPA